MNKTLAAATLSALMTTAATAGNATNINDADNCVKDWIDSIPYSTLKDIYMHKLHSGTETSEEYIDNLESLRQHARGSIDKCEEIYKEEVTSYAYGYVESLINNTLN